MNPSNVPTHRGPQAPRSLYEPFWTVAEELDFSIGFHAGSHDLPYDEHDARHDDVTWGGVCEESLSVLAGYI